VDFGCNRSDPADSLEASRPGSRPQNVKSHENVTWDCAHVAPAIVTRLADRGCIKVALNRYCPLMAAACSLNSIASIIGAVYFAKRPNASRRVGPCDCSAVSSSAPGS
jgi:hypothetical protein